MRVAISNIAWDVTEDEAVAALLQQHHIDAIDIAPGKYFPDPQSANQHEIAAVRQWWFDRGIEITGMQSLLFGTSGLNVFGNNEVQTAMLQHLEAICRIGSELGATRLVFGSPKNRDRNGLDTEQALDIAISFFQRLGDIAQNHHVLICLEPNPPCYGANFMINSDETAHVVKKISHPHICIQLDTGALTINQENPVTIIQHYAPLIGHIHASEPDLLPLGDAKTNHAVIGNLLQQLLPKHIVTIEMLATKNEPHLDAIARAVQVAIHQYRECKAGALA